MRRSFEDLDAIKFVDCVHSAGVLGCLGNEFYVARPDTRPFAAFV